MWTLKKAKHTKKFIDIVSRLMVARGGGTTGGMGEMEKEAQKGKENKNVRILILQNI